MVGLWSQVGRQAATFLLHLPHPNIKGVPSTQGSLLIHENVGLGYAFVN